MEEMHAKCIARRARMSGNRRGLATLAILTAFTLIGLVLYFGPALHVVAK